MYLYKTKQCHHIIEKASQEQEIKLPTKNMCSRNSCLLDIDLPVCCIEKDISGRTIKIYVTECAGYYTGASHVWVEPRENTP